VIGPAVNILPQGTADGRVVSVEWLNSTCTAYRREAFLAERFSERFVGYSFMEDVDLSVRVARRWKLVVHTGAQAYHDSQPSKFKRPYTKARMGVENQYYVMTQTLGRNSVNDHFRFLVNLIVARMVTVRKIRSRADMVEQVKVIFGAIVGLFCVVRKLTVKRRSVEALA
jgi:GT2 family glycosyltransferase